MTREAGKGTTAKQLNGCVLLPPEMFSTGWKADLVGLQGSNPPLGAAPKRVCTPIAKVCLNRLSAQPLLGPKSEFNVFSITILIYEF